MSSQLRWALFAFAAAMGSSSAARRFTHSSWNDIDFGGSILYLRYWSRRSRTMSDVTGLATP